MIRTRPATKEWRASYDNIDWSKKSTPADKAFDTADLYDATSEEEVTATTVSEAIQQALEGPGGSLVEAIVGCSPLTVIAYDIDKVPASHVVDALFKKRQDGDGEFCPYVDTLCDELEEALHSEYGGGEADIDVVTQPFIDALNADLRASLEKNAHLLNSSSLHTVGTRTFSEEELRAMFKSELEEEGCST